MSLINKQAPEWEAMAYCNGEFLEVSSKDYAGKWAVMFFYPADFTFVCPTELVNLAEHYDEFQALGVEVFAISTDKHFTHKAWHDSSPSVGTIEFPMVGDPTTQICAAFETLREDEGASDRSTFLIDPNGVIQFIETTAEGIGRNAAELLRKIRAAQHVAAHPGEVCPANWDIGEEVLIPCFDLVGKL